MRSEAVSHLKWLVDHLGALEKTVAGAEADIARLNTQRDQIHANIVRQAQIEGADSVERMATAARESAARLIADAQQQAEGILREARAKAAQLVSDGETAVRQFEQSVVIEKARALLSGASA
jgi:cell division septum initiation protein DivIVA